MSAIMCCTDETVLVDASEHGGTLELIRGNDIRFLARLAQRVRQQNVTLDLRSVARIDAAGLAALISLYRGATESGHTFTVTRPRPRIRQILALVGLDRILLA